MNFEWTLSDRQQRAVAMGLALIPVLLLLAVLVSAVMSWNAHHQRIAALLGQRATYQALLHDAPAWNAEIQRLRTSRAEADSFFVGTEASAAAPRMESRIKQIVTGDGGKLQHATVELKTAGDEAAVELRAAVSLSADIAELTRILHHLRQTHPLMMVTGLTVRSQAGTAALTAPNALQVDLVIVSYVRAP